MKPAGRGKKYWARVSERGTKFNAKSGRGSCTIDHTEILDAGTPGVTTSVLVKEFFGVGGNIMMGAPLLVPDADWFRVQS